MELEKIISRMITHVVKESNMDKKTIQSYIDDTYYLGDALGEHCISTLIFSRAFRETDIVESGMNILKRICENTDVAIPEDMVQEAYQGMIDKEIDGSGKFDNISVLRAISGIEPDDEMVQKAYNSLLSWHKMQYGNMFENLVKNTGIKPIFQEEYVQKAYEEAFGLDYITKEGVHGSRIFYPEQVKKIMELNGIKPSEKTVQAAYAQFLGKWHGEKDAKEIEKVTGVKPSISENILNKTYQRFMDQEDGKIPMIEDSYSRRCSFQYDWWRCKEITGINPLDEMVQKAYETCFKFTDIEAMANIFEITGIEPAKKLYKDIVHELSEKK